jgi:hypothetical protein
MNQPRKKPDLTPLPRSDEDLDRLSEVTMDDIEAAQNWAPVANNRNRDAAAFLGAGSDEGEDEGE